MRHVPFGAEPREVAQARPVPELPTEYGLERHDGELQQLDWLRDPWSELGRQLVQSEGPDPRLLRHEHLR